MAIIFEANYSKKLGLPGYSSHQYSLTVRAELSDITQVETESKRLYGLLQSSVDREIQQTGFLPGSNGNGGGNGNGHGHRQNGNGQGNGNANGNASGGEEAWNCSGKQKDLIQRIVTENNMDKNEIEALAQDRFGKGVMKLNKLEASGLIEELLERTGQSQSRGRFQGRQRTGGR